MKKIFAITAVLIIAFTIFINIPAEASGICSRRAFVVDASELPTVVEQFAADGCTDLRLQSKGNTDWLIYAN